MSVLLKTSLSRPAIAEGQPATLHLLIQLAAQAEPAGERPALNLTAVLDRSGSMAGPKLAHTKSARTGRRQDR